MGKLNLFPQLRMYFPAQIENGSPLIRHARSPWNFLFSAYDSHPELLIVFTLVLAVFLFWVFHSYRKMDEAKQTFPFLELPQELRDMVYEYLIEDPVYPAPSPSSKLPASVWTMPGRRSSSGSSRQARKSTWIFAVNKQIYREYMDMLCKKTTFHLTVSPQNFNPAPSSSQEDSETKPDNRLWKISPDTLKNLRTASLQLITTSAMLGVSDPRNMTSADWVLARQIREELKHVSHVKNITLDAKAIGDPLWNPLWIWYHASQSFKTMGASIGGADPVGPKLNRITFSIDNWSPGENYLERDENNKGGWAWHCMKGHIVSTDSDMEMTVREFCGKLYRECRVCRPELEDESDDEE